MAPTVPQEVESSGSRSTRRSYSARRPRGMPASAAAPSSPEEAAAGDSIGAQLVTPEPASASTAGGKALPASTAGGEELTAPASPAGGEEVEPMLEPEDTAAGAMLEPEDTAAAGAFLPNSSPLRMPYLLEQDSNGQLCEEQSPDPDPVLMEPYWKAEKEYFDKIAQITKLPTLDSDTATSPNIIQESEADTILKASEFVLGLSSYIDGELLRNCSGILMEWSKGAGTILTTSQLICSRSPNVDEWLGGESGDEYALNAEVRVQLLHKDDFGKGELMYLDKQYDFAVFRVLMDEPKKLPRFSNERFAQDVFLLGRYELNLQIGNGKVLSKGAGKFQHHHYMYTDGHISPFGAGGAVINFEGDVTGMITSSIHFIPSSIIRKCLEIWRTYSHVPRIHLGMKLFGIKCLNLVSKEKISRKYNVDAGLIVKEVSAESNAEKLGVRMGDIILSVNGEVIATAVELENKLLDISKALLEKGIVPGSGVDVTLALGVFNTTKCARGRILLRAKLSNDEEIIEEGCSVVSLKNLQLFVYG
ncbi:unnamed protein product [Miscanthus lutarioriparius]|uniref:PDZ domain-containing protein n=1 Tax=Miscanthus lutarioriparius TaxID=422564 RepID=A0A811RGZ8_9POAL|nr:unnamed protein product [Miscanthus lutarioriparius]